MLTIDSSIATIIPCRKQEQQIVFQWPDHKCYAFVKLLFDQWSVQDGEWEHYHGAESTFEQ